MSQAQFDRYLTEAEERDLLATIRRTAGLLAERDHAWVRLMRFTGIRVGALSRLTCSDARRALADGRLTLRAEIQKRKRGHSLYLSRQADAALRDLLRIRRAMGFFESDGAPLVMSQKGNSMSVRSYQDRLGNWGRDAGLGLDVSPHWLRHTFAKRLVARSEARDPRAVAQAALGHAERSSTDIYIRPDREQIERDIQRAAM